MSKLGEEIGKRLSEIRKSKKLKQEDLKKLIDAPTVQMISNWETGHTIPSADYLINISKKLDISLDYLLLGKKNDDIKEKTPLTYKEIIECMITLRYSGIFNFEVEQINNIESLTFQSHDLDILKYIHELECLEKALPVLGSEVFEEQKKKHIEKFDYPIKKHNYYPGF